MSNQRELTEVLRRLKKDNKCPSRGKINSLSCPRHTRSSRLPTLTLLNSIKRAEEAGVYVPPEKPKKKPRKSKAKPKTKKNSNKKILEDLIVFEKKFNTHLEELDKIFKSLKRNMGAEKQNEKIREFNKEYLNGYVKTREEFKVIAGKLENPPKNKKVKLQRDKILNIINKIEKRYEAMTNKVKDYSGQVKKRENLTLNEIIGRELGFS